MAGCTKDLHVFIYSGLIASYKPKPGERCICGEYSVEEMGAKGKKLNKLEQENARLRAALEAVEWVHDPETPEEGEDLTEYLCPWCFSEAAHGHIQNCPRQQALGGEEEGC